MLSLSVAEVVATPLQKSIHLVEVDSDRAKKINYGKVRRCRPGGAHVVCGVDWVMMYKAQVTEGKVIWRVR